MSLRHGILGLLSTHPASGYDLLSTFQETLANVWPATQSQLYGELNRLADEGLIRVTATGARGRKEYALTDAGSDELRHWIVDVEPKRVNRNDTLLRVFFLALITPKEAHAFIEHERAVYTAYGEELKGLLDTNDWDQGDLATNGRIALEWGLRYTKMQQEWADWALDQLGPQGGNA
jgi:DNA-binding PadR family transcriptional regulator